MKEIKPLTAMRGIFALWVVGFHFTTFSPVGFLFIPVISRGYLAVDFFFLLSGFVMAAAYGAEFAGSLRAAAYLKFLMKRVGRLFPVHITVIAVMLLALAAQGAPWPWRAYLAQEVLLAHRWWIFHAPAVGINGPDSGDVFEFAACLLFPACAVVTLRRSSVALIATVTSIIGIVWTAQRHGWSLDISMANSPLPLIRCLSEFSIGMIAFRIHSRLAFLAADGALTLIGLLVIILVLLPGTDVLAVAALLMLLIGLANNDGLVARALSGASLQRLGALSYSIYLVQGPAIQVAHRFADEFDSQPSKMAAFVGCAIVGILAFAPVAHAVIEQGGRTQTNELLRRWSGPTAKG